MNPTTKQVCGKCGATKVFRVGRYKCRTCIAAYNALWNANHPEYSKRYKAARRKCEEMKMPSNSLYRPKLIALMSDGVPRACTEMTLAVGCGDKLIRTFIDQMLADGSAHIDSYRGPHAVALYRAGAGENAARPVRRSNPKKLELERVTYRKRSPGRSRYDDDAPFPGDWWIPSDPVVVAAMSAMIRTAHVA